MTYFRNLLDLLKLEREEDRKQYQQLIQTTSLQERRASGLTWYPIAIRGSELGRGEYLTVDIERPTHQDIPHQLRFGMPAVLFSNHDPRTDRLEGIIAHQSGNRLRLSLRVDELPDWSREGKLGVELLFDDNSYDEMEEALRTADTLSQQPGQPLIPILTGAQAPTFNPHVAEQVLPGLNPSQTTAVNRIRSANELAIVHGPPGTGKTTTLVQAINVLVRQDRQKLLVVAPSNAAVDLLSEKLHEQGLHVLRIGNPARVSERLMALTLDQQVSEHPYLKEARKLRKQANEYRAMAHKYKRNFGKAEREQRKALFEEAHKLLKEVAQSEQYVIDDLIARAQVITATLVGANQHSIRKLSYDTVVIDEAGQALEPACWIPMLKARKVVLAGDHCQLPPTIKSPDAARRGLATTLLEKCVTLHPEAVSLLDEQYRMHEHIMGYSSRVFYENKVKAHASVARHTLFEGDTSLAFVDTAGCGFEEKLEGTSSTNPEEAALLVRHLTELVTGLGGRYTPAAFPTIAVISPYKQQLALLQAQIQGTPELQPYRDRIAVNTIDSFQGQERDIVYISLVRSNAGGDIGFLSDIRRMNVAMTRARKKLVIVGDSATLASLPFYSDFVAYSEELGTYQSAWEFL